MRLLYIPLLPPKCQRNSPRHSAYVLITTMHITPLCYNLARAYYTNAAKVAHIAGALPVYSHGLSLTAASPVQQEIFGHRTRQPAVVPAAGKFPRRLL